MHYVYFLKSINNPHQSYVGHTNDLEERLKSHNSGRSPHTAKYRPWEITFYIAFKNESEAIDFESYLKTSSGKSFALKRLLPK